MAKQGAESSPPGGGFECTQQNQEKTWELVLMFRDTRRVSICSLGGYHGSKDLSPNDITEIVTFEADDCLGVVRFHQFFDS